MPISINSLRSKGIRNTFFWTRTYYEDGVRDERNVIWLRFTTQDKLIEFMDLNVNFSPYFQSHPDEITQNMLAVVGMAGSSRQSLINIVNSALQSHR